MAHFSVNIVKMEKLHHKVFSKKKTEKPDFFFLICILSKYLHSWSIWMFTCQLQNVTIPEFLTLLLLNTTCPVLANSVDPDQLASEEANWSGSALFVIKYVNFYQKSDWLEIRSGCGILIYSALQGLINPFSLADQKRYLCSVDLDETAHDELSHQDLHRLPFSFWF